MIFQNVEMWKCVTDEWDEVGHGISDIPPGHVCKQNLNKVLN